MKAESAKYYTSFLGVSCWMLSGCPLNTTSTLGNGPNNASTPTTPLGQLKATVGASPTVWLDSAQITVADPTTTSQVKTWNDVSGNNNHATYPTGAGIPTYTVPGYKPKSQTVNGVPSITFADPTMNDVGSCLSSQTGFPANSEFSFSVVFQWNVPSTQIPIGPSNTSQVNIMQSNYFGSGYPQFAFYLNHPQADPNTDLIASLQGLVPTMVYNYSQPLVDTTTCLRPNSNFHEVTVIRRKLPSGSLATLISIDGYQNLQGVQDNGYGNWYQDPNTFAAGIASPQTVSDSSFRIGCTQNTVHDVVNAWRGLNGEIQEVLIFNSALTSAQLTSLETYLINKHNITADPSCSFRRNVNSNPTGPTISTSSPTVTPTVSPTGSQY